MTKRKKWPDPKDEPKAVEPERVEWERKVVLAGTQKPR